MKEFGTSLAQLIDRRTMGFSMPSENKGLLRQTVGLLIPHGAQAFVVLSSIDYFIQSSASIMEEADWSNGFPTKAQVPS
jgi:hypothetical protein